MISSRVLIYRNVVITASLLIIAAIALSWLFQGAFRRNEYPSEIISVLDDDWYLDDALLDHVDEPDDDYFLFYEEEAHGAAQAAPDGFFDVDLPRNDRASAPGGAFTAEGAKLAAAAGRGASYMRGQGDASEDQLDAGNGSSADLNDTQLIAARSALYPDAPLSSLGPSVALGSLYGGNGLSSIVSPVAGAFMHAGGVIMEDENLLAFMKENEQPRKPVYLTIDDGPSALTRKYLDVLAANDVRATFFVIGKNVTAYKDVVKEMYDAGHCIANHSYTHQYESVYKSSASLRSELEKCEKAIGNALGIDYHTDIFRFPGGSTYKLASKYRNEIRAMGYKYYDWNCLNGDAQIKDKSADSLYDYMVSTFKNQDEVIVLMHDIENKQTTIDMLERAIDFFKDNGYEFKTLDEKK